MGGEYSLGAENGICVIWGDYGNCEAAVGMIGDVFFGGNTGLGFGFGCGECRRNWLVNGTLRAEPWSKSGLCDKLLQPCFGKDGLKLAYLPVGPLPRH